MNFNYAELISMENLLRSWRTYKKGKSQKTDVIEFERHSEDNLFSLHQELYTSNYIHDKYSYFRISDPKKRDIYKATIKDRIIHQALYAYLCEIYEPIFIELSFSSRKKKGTHKAISALVEIVKNFKKDNRRCLSMKCDIRKYFENINHKILLDILRSNVPDEKIFNLLKIVVESFHKETAEGVPLGNITSQIFANIYLNELDSFVSNKLKIKDYIRYNDDFVVLESDREKLFADILKIKLFLKEKLSLDLPQEKTTFRKLAWGIDFCGYIMLPNSILLRHKTKGRMLEKIDTASMKLNTGKISTNDYQKIMDSYLGLIAYCKSYNLKSKIEEIIRMNQCFNTLKD